MRDRIWFMVLVLGLVGGAAGLALATVKRVTDPIIEQGTLTQKVKPALTVFFAGLNPENDPIADRVTLELGQDERGRVKRLMVFPASKDGATVGVALRTIAGGFGGELEVLTALDLRDERLLGAKALALSETKGIGSRVGDDDEPFVRQFAGLSYGDGVRLIADGGEVEAITGATVSSTAFTQAVDAAVKLLNERRAEVIGEGSK